MYEAYAPYFGSIGELQVHDAWNVFQDLLELIHYCLNQDISKKTPKDKCQGCMVH